MRSTTQRPGAGGTDAPGHGAAGDPASPQHLHGVRRRPVLSWWPIATGLALGVFSIATDDPESNLGSLLTLAIPTCAYVLIALTGRRSWSWPVTAAVVVVLFAGEALGLSGAIVLVTVTLVGLAVGAALRRWRPPPAGMGWQPWGALFFLAGVTAALLLDVTAAKVVLAVGLLLHGAWDLVHRRHWGVVSRSLAEWCAALDITLGLGLLALVLFT